MWSSAMKRYIVILMMCCLFTMPLAFSPVHAQKIVQAQGTASIHKNFVAIARDRAIDDAQRLAIEQAVGVMISNETLVENYQVISDKILQQSKGYIQSYEILSDQREGNIYKVTIQAVVSIGQIKNDLEAIHLVIARKFKPRLMILFDGRDQEDSIAEAGMTKYFLSKGFKLVNSDIVRKNLEYDRLMNLARDPQGAAKVGKRFGAEVILLCSAETSSSAFRVGDVEMYTNRATISAKVVNADTGSIITTGSETKRIPGIQGLIQPTTEQGAELLASKLMNDILNQWSSELTNTVEVKLFVSQFRSFDELSSFKTFLTNEVRGIKDIRLRSYAQGRAEMELDFQGDSQSLANDLEGRNVGSRSITISEISQNRLEIELSP
jgi:hypothetical protein